jgi:hypothetical protein
MRNGRKRAECTPSGQRVWAELVVPQVFVAEASRGMGLAMGSGGHHQGGAVLGEIYLARCGTGFEAYMALQRALIARWVARGGTEQSWCERIAPLYRQRYAMLMR